MADTKPSSLDEFCQHRLAALETRHARRYFATTHRKADAYAEQHSEQHTEHHSEQNDQPATLISFSCNDYLGLSQHPSVIQAAQQAAAQYGVGAGASRLITGNHPLFAALEQRLAALKETEDALVFGSGYLANMGIIPALCGKRDVLLIDELAHACITSAARLSGGRVIRFRHNDMDALKQHLKTERRAFEKCLIITDGVFSMDGDIAALPSMRELADKYDAWLMSDDAHGLGVVGGGRGSAHAFSPSVHIDIQMGTLSKAGGGYGGYVCGSHALCEWLRNRARTMVFSTGLPPMNIAAACAALDVMASDKALVEKPVQNARDFCRLVGLTEPQSPIVPVILHSNKTALQASATLAKQGFLVHAIRPPTVPKNTARLRLAFNALHKSEDINALANAVRTILSHRD